MVLAVDFKCYIFTIKAFFKLTFRKTSGKKQYARKTFTEITIKILMLACFKKVDSKL